MCSNESINQYSMDILHKNLAEINLANNYLYTRLCYSVDNSHVKIDNDKFYYKIHSDWIDFSSTQIDLTQLLNKSNVILFGISTGLNLDKILQQKTVEKIFVWERDPWLLRLALMRRSYCNEIKNNKLQFFLGADILNIKKYYSQSCLISEPFFQSLYKNEFDLLVNNIKKNLALVCSGGLFIDDLVDTLNYKGYSIYIWDHLKLALEESEELVKNLKPKVIVSINYFLGLAEFCEKLKMCENLC